MSQYSSVIRRDIMHTCVRFDIRLLGESCVLHPYEYNCDYPRNTINGNVYPILLRCNILMFCLDPMSLHEVSERTDFVLSAFIDHAAVYLVLITIET